MIYWSQLPMNVFVFLFEVKWAMTHVNPAGIAVAKNTSISMTKGHKINLATEQWWTTHTDVSPVSQL